MNEEIVSIKNVSFHYGDLLVLDDVNLTIRQGDFLGIIGPNGGGKTTLLKIMLGLLKPDRGEVTVFGKPCDRSRQMIGYVPQHIEFDREFPVNVRDVVLMGRLRHCPPLRYYNAVDHSEADKAIATVGLDGFQRRPIGELSQGQKQRVFIARALASEPKLLLMDEPTASVDPGVQKEFYSLLGELNKRVPVVLVSHDIGVIASCVNKIACLNVTLHYHDTGEISPEDLNKTYGSCSVEMIAHGVPHRVLKKHS